MKKWRVPVTGRLENFYFDRKEIFLLKKLKGDNYRGDDGVGFTRIGY